MRAASPQCRGTRTRCTLSGWRSRSQRTPGRLPWRLRTPPRRCEVSIFLDISQHMTSCFCPEGRYTGALMDEPLALRCMPLCLGAAPILRGLLTHIMSSCKTEHSAISMLPWKSDPLHCRHPADRLGSRPCGFLNLLARSQAHLLRHVCCRCACQRARVRTTCCRPLPALCRPAAVHKGSRSPVWFRVSAACKMGGFTDRMQTVICCGASLPLSTDVMWTAG